MRDLADFLRARLYEDEALARAAIRAVGDVPGGVPGAANWRFGNAYTDDSGTYWQITTTPPDAEVFGPVELMGSGMSGGGAHEPEIARHAAEHDPARVLAELEAKRGILDMYDQLTATIRHPASDVGLQAARTQQLAVLKVLKLLAAPYNDHPDYQGDLAPMTHDLIAFLRARFDEDQAVAQRASDDLGRVLHQVEYSDSAVEADERHIARHDPARVLAEVEAKRRILEIHHVIGGWEDENMTDLGDGCAECGYSAAYGDQGGWCETVRLLALPYAVHPDCRDEWRP